MSFCAGSRGDDLQRGESRNSAAGHAYLQQKSRRLRSWKSPETWGTCSAQALVSTVSTSQALSYRSPNMTAGCFQVKLAGSWRDFDQRQDTILKRAYMAGLDVVPCKVGGQRYQVDFRRMTQTNLESRKTRAIRPPPGWKGEEPGRTRPAQKLRVTVPEGTAGKCIYVPDPRTDQFIAVQVPAAARAGDPMLVPLPPVVTPPTKAFDSFKPSAPAVPPMPPMPPCTETPETPIVKSTKSDTDPKKAGATRWSPGAKVAAGGAAVLAVGGLAVAGVVLGEHIADVGWTGIVEDVEHVAADVADAAGDAGEWVAEAAHDTADFVMELF